MQVNAAISAHRIDTPGKEARATRHSRFALAMVSRMPLSIGGYFVKRRFVRQTSDWCDGPPCRPLCVHGSNTQWNKKHPKGKTRTASNQAYRRRW